MTAAELAVTGLSETEHSRQLRRALIASTVGTTIEWYDFLLYGQVTGLVFGKLFFPQSDPLVGVLQAFAVFFVGFLGRPIGAAIPRYLPPFNPACRSLFISSAAPSSASSRPCYSRT